MQVTERFAEGLKRTYSATATAAEIEAKVDEKLEEVRPSAQLKGFRRGKVPHSLLKKYFYKSVLSEVMQEIVDTTVRGHFEESGHRPAIEPKVKVLNEQGIDEGQDLNVEFSYEMMPDIPEVPLNAIALERLVVEPAEEEVEKALANLASSATTYATKEGAAEDGDQVVINFLGKIDGEPFDGGAAEDFPLALGSNQFIPGFEAQLVGVSAGEERSVEVAFPEDYGAKGLAGKDAVFEVTVKEVQAPSPAAVDDALAQKYGLETLEALRGQIKERMGEEYRSAARSLMKRRLLDHLNETVDFDLPETMLTQEAEQVARQLQSEQDGSEDAPEEGADETTGDAAAETAEATSEQAATDGEAGDPSGDGGDEQAAAPSVTDEHRALARRRVKLGLLLADVGAKNSITLTEPEVQNAIMAWARRYPGHEREFMEIAQSNAAIRQQISAPAFEDKVVDYVFELAAVTDKSVSADDLKQALEALDEEDS